MRKSTTVDVDETDRRRLTAIVTDRHSPQKHVWRAQIVLLTADGCGTMELTRRTGTSKTSVWRWQKRFKPNFPTGYKNAIYIISLLSVEPFRHHTFLACAWAFGGAIEQKTAIGP